MLHRCLKAIKQKAASKKRNSTAKDDGKKKKQKKDANSNVRLGASTTSEVDLDTAATVGLGECMKEQDDI